MKEMLEAAKAAKSQIAGLTSQEKNAALNAMAGSLMNCEKAILEANALDLQAAQGHVSDVMLDRLWLTSARIAGMATGTRAVAQLPDPASGTGCGACHQRKRHRCHGGDRNWRQ